MKKKELQIDDFYTWTISEQVRSRFLIHAIKYIQKYNWSDQNHEAKIFMILTTHMIRKLQLPFNAQRHKSYSYGLPLEELLCVDRLLKIFQIEIGEENDDQQLFQEEAKKIFEFV